MDRDAQLDAKAWHPEWFISARPIGIPWPHPLRLEPPWPDDGKTERSGLDWFRYIYTGGRTTR